MSADDDRPCSEVCEVLKRQGFTIERKMGSGAFGSVYRARQNSLGRPVAVKVFDGPALRIPDNRVRLQREAPLLAKLSHPSIPYVITQGEAVAASGKIQYFVMQLVEGKPLNEVIAAKRRLEAQPAITIARHVLSAVDHAHRSNVLHRDIAPDNILVGDEVTYLIDFSVGVSLDEDADARPTVTGVRIGRADYAPPEQRKDAKSVNRASDIYSVGIVLFEMLAGHPRLRIEHLAEDLRHVSPELCTILRKACASEHSERYGSASLFRNALDTLTLNTSPLAEPTVSLCPNKNCADACWSQNEYFKGPHIEETAYAHCQRTGTRFMKRCEGCGAPLRGDLKAYLYTAKSQHDTLTAFCASCGHLIFETPTCQKCGSLLKSADMDKDTNSTGCTKCRRKETRVTGFPTADDIPF
jgi:serine/threonine protein kinase